ncbi:hypothetical protein [Bacteroides ihuae]|uniref:hypothetical protein n=1 Tax=Bacteroides ihuae TaxID=1852362 RepID=UPI0008D97734|nr:hypothetical protein [Bacteroides ihuae]
MKEKYLLLEISGLCHKLKEEPRKSFPNGYEYVRIADALRTKVALFFEAFTPAYFDEATLDQFIHTCVKEVLYVESNYESIRVKAGKKQEMEFLESMRKATRQIEIDLSALLEEANK